MDRTNQDPLSPLDGPIWKFHCSPKMTNINKCSLYLNLAHICRPLPRPTATDRDDKDVAITSSSTSNPFWVQQDSSSSNESKRTETSSDERSSVTLPNTAKLDNANIKDHGRRRTEANTLTEQKMVEHRDKLSAELIYDGCKEHSRSETVLTQNGATDGIIWNNQKDDRRYIGCPYDSVRSTDSQTDVKNADANVVGWQRRDDPNGNNGHSSKPRRNYSNGHTVDMTRSVVQRQHATLLCPKDNSQFNHLPHRDAVWQSHDQDERSTSTNRVPSANNVAKASQPLLSDPTTEPVWEREYSDHRYRKPTSSHTVFREWGERNHQRSQSICQQYSAPRNSAPRNSAPQHQVVPTSAKKLPTTSKPRHCYVQNPGGNSGDTYRLAKFIHRVSLSPNFEDSLNNNYVYAERISSTDTDSSGDTFTSVLRVSPSEQRSGEVFLDSVNNNTIFRGNGDSMTRTKNDKRSPIVTYQNHQIPEPTLSPAVTYSGTAPHTIQPYDSRERYVTGPRQRECHQPHGLHSNYPYVTSPKPPGYNPGLKFDTHNLNRPDATLTFGNNCIYNTRDANAKMEHPVDQKRSAGNLLQDQSTRLTARTQLDYFEQKFGAGVNRWDCSSAIDSPIQPIRMINGMKRDGSSQI